MAKGKLLTKFMKMVPFLFLLLTEAFKSSCIRGINPSEKRDLSVLQSYASITVVRRKTIYEYHKIDMKKSATIGNWTAIFFKALPTCVSLTSCRDCLSEKISFQVI